MADDEAAPSEVAPSKNSNVPAALGETPAVRVRAVPSSCGDDGVTVRLVVVWAVMSTTFAVEVEPTNAVESAGVKCTVYEWPPMPGLCVLVSEDEAAPSEVAPSKNSNVPAAVGETPAVRVSVVPSTCGDDGVTERVVVVGTAVTGGGEMVIALAAEVDGLNAVVAGRNLAVYEWLPEPGVTILVLAADGAPSEVAPSKNSTVPVAPAGATAAVRVMAVPAGCGDVAGLSVSVVVVSWMTV